MAPTKDVPHCFATYHQKDEKYLNVLKNICKVVTANDLENLLDKQQNNASNDVYTQLREKMLACPVTVVLIGSKTGHQKFIDYQIWASLRAEGTSTKLNKGFESNGLLGIYLPDNLHSVPNRFEDNVKSDYAVIMRWEDVERDFETNLKKAYWNRNVNGYKIRNSRELQTRDEKELYGFKKIDRPLFQIAR